MFFNGSWTSIRMILHDRQSMLSWFSMLYCNNNINYKDEKSTCAERSCSWFLDFFSGFATYVFFLPSPLLEIADFRFCVSLLKKKTAQEPRSLLLSLNGRCSTAARDGWIRGKKWPVFDMGIFWIQEDLDTTNGISWDFMNSKYQNWIWID